MDVCNDVSTVYFLIMMKSKSGDKSTRSTFSDFFGYFFSRKVYFSQIWWAIFLETIFLHFINMHMEKRSKFQTFSAHSISTTIWPPGGTTCISWKFSHQVTPLAIVGNLATRTRNLNYLKIWPPGGTICISWKFWPPSGSTCISWKFGDQVVSLVLVINLATRWHHLYCF